MTEEKPYLEFGGTSVPIKAWVRGVPFDDGARRQLENTARLPFVYKLDRGHARRALGTRSDGGQRRGDQGRDRAGRRRRGHRLRHGGRAHHARCGRPAGQPAPHAQGLSRRPCRTASRRAAVAGTWAPGAATPAGIADAWKPLAEGYDRLVARHGDARPEPAPDRPARNAGQRQPLHRGVPGRGGPRLVHAPQRLARRRQPHRDSTSSSEPASEMQRQMVNLPDRDLAYLREGTAGLRRVRGGGGLGAAVRCPEPARS